MRKRLFGRNAYWNKTLLIGGLKVHCNSFYRQRGRLGREYKAEFIYCRWNRTTLKEIVKIPYNLFGPYNSVNSNRKYFKIINHG